MSTASFWSLTAVATSQGSTKRVGPAAHKPDASKPKECNHVA